MKAYEVSPVGRVEARAFGAVRAKGLGPDTPVTHVVLRRYVIEKAFPGAFLLAWHLATHLP